MADTEVNIYADSRTYYSTGNNNSNNSLNVSRFRSFASSMSNKPSQKEVGRRRRASHDEVTKPRRFIIDVEETKRQILEQEDTDGDNQITIHDIGPKTLTVGTADSGGHRKFEIRGTYMISNLLQELALAEDIGRKRIVFG